jgi:hypothetical protein
MNELELKPKVSLTIVVKDKNGNIINAIHKDNDPLTRWAMRSLYTSLTRINTTVKDETGALRTFRSDVLTFKWNFKIAIGLDSTTPTFDDFKLGAKEREATDITTTALTEQDSTAVFEIKKDFLIEVDKIFYEFGLFGIGQDSTSTYPFLVSHDVVSSGVTVPANSFLTVVYRVILGTV